MKYYLEVIGGSYYLFRKPKKYMVLVASAYEKDLNFMCRLLIGALKLNQKEKKEIPILLATEIYNLKWSKTYVGGVDL